MPPSFYHMAYIIQYPKKNWNYERLREADKPAKVVSIAIFCKLIAVLNRVVQYQSPWQEHLEQTA